MCACLPASGSEYLDGHMAQGLAMLITVSAFDWQAEAKRALLLLEQHDRAVEGEGEALLDGAVVPQEERPGGQGNFAQAV